MLCVWQHLCMMLPVERHHLNLTKLLKKVELPGVLSPLGVCGTQITRTQFKYTTFQHATITLKHHRLESGSWATDTKWEGAVEELLQAEPSSTTHTTQPKLMRG